MRAAVIALISAIGMPMSSTPNAASTGVRSVYLNGIDISSAKSQDLKNVDIHINENGDIFIVAPHYQVNEEDTYVPLSKYVQGLNQPMHKPPQAIGGSPDSKVGSKDKAEKAPVTKPDEPMSPPAASNQINAAPAVGKDDGATAAPVAAPAEQTPKSEDPPPALPEDSAAKDDVLGK